MVKVSPESAGLDCFQLRIIHVPKWYVLGSLIVLLFTLTVITVSFSYKFLWKTYRCPMRSWISQKTFSRTSLAVFIEMTLKTKIFLYNMNGSKINYVHVKFQLSIYQLAIFSPTPVWLLNNTFYGSLFNLKTQTIFFQICLLQSENPEEII